jgi:hypothetical protein
LLSRRVDLSDLQGELSAINKQVPAQVRRWQTAKNVGRAFKCPIGSLKVPRISIPDA